MVVSCLKIGMIGISEGNGHPYSFSAIINGYDRAAMKESGWSGIYNYLEKKNIADFLNGEVVVTHIWTQNIEESQRIARASKIEKVCVNLEDMISEVDAVIIARDDFETHARIAAPFLKNGVKVFVDKPLAVNVDDLRFFKPYLDSGQLMSCSGLRYCAELDDARQLLKGEKQFKLIRGAVINSWEKYGIHMLDAIYGTVQFNVKSVLATDCQHFSIILKNIDKTIIQIDALGDAPVSFMIDIWGANNRFNIDIRDNFTAFKRTMFHFIEMIRTGVPQISPELTINLMKVIIAGRQSLIEKREVFLDEIKI